MRPRCRARATGTIPIFVPSSSALAEDTEPRGLGGGLAARARSELAQDRGDVVVDRSAGDDETVCDLRVSQPLGEECQHLGLASRQTGRARRRALARTARDALRTPVTQAASDDGGRGASTEPAELVERASLGFLVTVGLRERSLVRALELV